MSVKPVAWMRGGQPYLEPAGVTYEVPLYSAPAPELAEALQRMVDICQDCDGEGTQFFADGRTAHGGAFVNHRPCPNCSEARKLLARITPK